MRIIDKRRSGARFAPAKHGPVDRVFFAWEGAQGAQQDDEHPKGRTPNHSPHEVSERNGWWRPSQVGWRPSLERNGGLKISETDTCRTSFHLHAMNRDLRRFVRPWNVAQKRDPSLIQALVEFRAIAIEFTKKVGVYKHKEEKRR